MLVKTSRGTREKERREREREPGMHANGMCCYSSQKKSNPKSTQNTKLLNPSKPPISATQAPAKLSQSKPSTVSSQTSMDRLHRSSQGLTALGMWRGRCVNYVVNSIIVEIIFCIESHLRNFIQRIQRQTYCIASRSQKLCLLLFRP